MRMFLRAFLNHRFAVGSLALLIGWGVLLFLPFDYAYALLSGLCFSIAVGVIVGWWHAIVRALESLRPDDGDHLVLGVACQMLSIVLIGVYSIANRIWEQPYWLRDIPVLLLFLELRLAGAILHLTAPNVVANRVPAENWRRIGLWVFLGLGLASVFILTSIWVAEKRAESGGALTVSMHGLL